MFMYIGIWRIEYTFHVDPYLMVNLFTQTISPCMIMINCAYSVNKQFFSSSSRINWNFFSHKWFTILFILSQIKTLKCYCGNIIFWRKRKWLIYGHCPNRGGGEEPWRYLFGIEFLKISFNMIARQTIAYNHQLC